MTVNRLLTNVDREKYKKIINDMFEICPETMSRKIPEANVQQAFVLDKILRAIYGNLEVPILSVGCFEDTAYEYLDRAGYDIVGIDPEINVDLKTFHSTCDKVFAAVFSTSVLEHVVDDESFMAYFCDLVAPGGLGILTCDFNNGYKPGDVVPATVVRQYTKFDLEVRFKKVLDRYGCKLLGKPNWDGKPDFLYQGHWYSFATYVFGKMGKYVR